MPQLPKLDPVRRHPRVGAVLLPAGGRAGDPPRWPLDGLSAAEEACWRDLWASPQAVMWERMGCIRVVARYCRMSVAADKPETKAALHVQVTALADRLGLTPKAMRVLLWQIAPDEIGEKREQAPPAPHGARGRIKAV